jgi:hypothetical protein
VSLTRRFSRLRVKKQIADRRSLSVIGRFVGDNCSAALVDAFFRSTPVRGTAKMKLPAQFQGPHALNASFARASWTRIALAAAFLLASHCAAAADHILWKTGQSFKQECDQQAGVIWKDRPLRDGLVRLAEEYRVAIFLDRRIDPGKEVTVSVADRPLHEVLAEVAAAAGGGMTILPPVVYIGPVQTASRLATLAAQRRQEAAKLPAAIRAKLLHAEAWQWDELAQPRQLLDDLARQAGVSVVNADAVPLDLWPAVELPPLAWVDRVTILLAGFDLTFEFSRDGAAVRLITPPPTQFVERAYTPRGDLEAFRLRIQRLLPSAQVRTESEKLVVAATPDDHDKLQRLIAVKPANAKPTKGDVEKLHSMQVEKERVGNVVKTVANFMGKEMRYDPSVVDKLKQPVDLKLKDVSLEYILEVTLKPLGLTYRIKDDVLEVIPAKP